MGIKKILSAYFNQNVIAFHSGAIGGTMKGRADIARFRQSKLEDPPSKRAFKILIAVPSAESALPGMTEVAHLYNKFTSAGYSVDFATADGRSVEFSHSDLTDPVNRWFAEDQKARFKTDQPLEIKEVMPSRYAAVYFAGRNGLVTENHWFRTLSEQILNNSGIVAGSGNGPEAVNSLRLNAHLDSGYSAPASEAPRFVSEYGSAATQAVAEQTGWIIHHNKLTTPETETFSEMGEQIVMTLEA